MMKHLKYFFVIAIAIIVSGCATDIYTRTYHQSGVAYRVAGNYDAAIEQFKKAIEQDPNDPNNYDWLGLSYQEKSQYKDAVVWYQKAIAKGLTNSPTFSRLAQCYNKLNQYDDAILAGRRAIELDFTNEVAHFELACAFFKTKQYKNANKAYKKAIELDPKDPTYYNRWGYLLFRSGDYAGAAEQYKKAVSLRPNNTIYLSNLAYAYCNQGKYDDALDAFDKTISLMSFGGIGAEIQIVENYLVVTSVFDPSPAKRAGIKAGDKISKIDGKRTKKWKLNDVISAIKGQEGTKVVFSIKRKDTKKNLEIAVIREKVFLKEASSDISLRSYSLRHIGKKQESLKDAKQAYSLDSSYVWAQLALGAAYLDQGQYDEAIKLLSQMKDNVYARIFEATAHAKKGDFNKAVEIYTAIPEEKLSPKNVPLWSDRTVLLEAFKPFIASKVQNASSLKVQGRYKEALNELGNALKVSDDQESKKVFSEISAIMETDPKLSELPEEARKYALRGDVLTKQGKFEEAAKQYRKAVRAAPYIAKLYFNTAMIYGELKRFSQAIRNMKTYLNLAPEAPNARAAKDQIYKWEFMMEKGE
ncbi:MAG: tetratricopeptide repeat protein [Deltaproteobacteria bacterium]|nr:tetratricopeptide repeat protein [Deltaproteobacteria bacterium]